MWTATRFGKIGGRRAILRPMMLPRVIRFAPEPESYAAIVAVLERDGLPLIDNIRRTLPVVGEAIEPRYRRVIEELPLGVIRSDRLPRHPAPRGPKLVAKFRRRIE